LIAVESKIFRDSGNPDKRDYDPAVLSRPIKETVCPRSDPLALTRLTLSIVDCGAFAHGS